MRSDRSLVEVGYVAKAHGVRGELRVHLHNPDSEALFSVEQLVVGERDYRIAGARPGGKGGVLLALDGVTDRNAAEALRGCAVSVDRDALELDEGDVLAVDLIGCAAVLEDGTPWGVVEEIVVGAQDRLVIRDGDVVRELPWVDELVRSIDLEARRVVVAPPDGLPEERVPR